MGELFDTLPEDVQKTLPRTKMPAWTIPMLAKPSEAVFSNPKWLFERKFDGERCLAFRRGRTVELYSRNKNKLNNSYPELVDALRQQPLKQFIVDGEIVAFDGDRTSFERLQPRMQNKDPVKARKSGVAVFYYLFDAIYLADRLIDSLDLKNRKTLLKKALRFMDPLRYSAHWLRDGTRYYEQACNKRWEGLIAKRSESQYVHARSSNWLKFKCSAGQEFVIGGYTDPQGSRTGFGALLAGYYDGPYLKYAGKIGTGYNEKTLQSLRKEMASMLLNAPPFEKEKSLPRKRVHWVKPKLVVEVRFTEWTSDGKLRHPAFVGIRRDKKPRDVIRESPA